MIFTKFVPGSQAWAVRLAENSAVSAAAWAQNGAKVRGWFFMRRCIDLCRDYPAYRQEIKAAFRAQYWIILRAWEAGVIAKPEAGSKPERYTCECGREYKAWPFWDDRGLGYQYERGDSGDLLGCDCGAELPLSR